MPKEIPPYITDELSSRGMVIVSQGFNGTNHNTVEVQARNGSRFKWNWPHEGKCDPRAMKNNRTQLRQYLNHLEELWRTRKN